MVKTQINIAAMANALFLKIDNLQPIHLPIIK